jgi:hypothetical protein
MAETPTPKLLFTGQCPDCGERVIDPPAALPEVGDDFDWRVRDYDSFRRFMMEELIARFPERRRWTDGDIEVVIVEALSAVLDQLSDMADRVAAEAFLESARRPESVRRLLKLIGYDAVQAARARDEIDPGLDEAEAEGKLHRYWLNNPHSMELARYAGPRAVHTQRRMVTVDDYGTRLEEHPLVLRAQAWARWGGSWSVVRAAVIGRDNLKLDEAPGGTGYSSDVREAVELFHKDRGLPVPYWDAEPTIRTVLRPYIDAYRMAGQEVMLQDVEPVGISLSIAIGIDDSYFQSEVRRAVQLTLGTGAGGFFEPGRLAFGEDLYAADIFQALMALDGVRNVCLNRFKRIGDQFADQSETGRIKLDDLEVAVCDNDRSDPLRGYYTLTLHGGRRG